MGLPQRTQSDKGGENLLVIQEMFARRPEADRPTITGRSIWNTKIEHFLVRTNSTVSLRFNEIFLILHEESLLDDKHELNWELDRFLLARVFL